MSIRVYIADDHRLFREGLKELVNKDSNMHVVGEAEDGQAAIRALAKTNPDVVIMDVCMPDINGIEAARQILRDFPEIKILALSMHSDPNYVAQMLRAGAKGYLLKDSAAQELTEAVRTVSGNLTYLSPRVAGSVVDSHVRNHTPPGESSAYTVLSSREREVLQMLAEGNSTKAIADKLFVSVKTVETHRRNIMKKLAISSVAGLTKYAVREGLTSVD